MYDKWFVLYVRTGSEKLVKRLLDKYFSDRNMNFINPIIILRIRSKGIWSETEKDMLPGYLLVNGDVSFEDYYEIKRIPKIFTLLKNNCEFSEVPEAEIGLLGQLISENGFIEESNVYLDENSRIVIIDGPLKGLEGYIVKVDKHARRVTIKVNFMNSESRYTLGINFVKKLEIDEKGFVS